MLTELYLDETFRAAWALLQDAGGSPSLRETGRQVASILGVLLLTGLWLYLAINRDRRMASLTILVIMGLASGAGYAIGKEPRLELLRAGVSQLLILVEVLIALPGGWREAVRTLIVFVLTTLVAASVGAAVAASLGGAGFLGELIVELIVALFF